MTHNDSQAVSRDSLTFVHVLFPSLQQLQVVTPIQLLYHPELVLQGEVCTKAPVLQPASPSVGAGLLE